MDGLPDERTDRLQFSSQAIPIFSLVVKQSEFAKAKREAEEAGSQAPDLRVPANWPPAGWQRDEFPIDGSFTAARQWVNYLQRTLDGTDSFSGVGAHTNALPEVLNDLNLLVRHFAQLDYANSPALATAWRAPYEMRVDLAKVNEWLIELIGGIDPSESAVVSAPSGFEGECSAETPPPEWLLNLAIQVRSLVRTDGGMARFREMIPDWSHEIAECRVMPSYGSLKGVPSASVPYDDGIDLIPFPSRVLTFREKYAVLGALHDVCCKGEKIDPWREATFPPPLEALPYAVLRAAFRNPPATRLVGAGEWIVPETDKYLFDEIIADVKNDLESSERLSELEVKQTANSPFAALEPADGLMTRDEIAHVVAHKLGGRVAGKTLLNKNLLGEPALRGRGRGNRSRWDYRTVAPAIEAVYHVTLPGLAEAFDIISKQQ